MLDQFFGVDPLDNQAAERGGVLDFLPSLFEDCPEHPDLSHRRDSVFYSAFVGVLEFVGFCPKPHPQHQRL